MGDIAGRAVAVDQAQRHLPEVGHLVKHTRRDRDRLSRNQHCPLRAQAHLAGAFEHQVDLFLLLVVPRHLTAVGLEGHVSH